MRADRLPRDPALAHTPVLLRPPPAGSRCEHGVVPFTLRDRLSGSPDPRCRRRARYRVRTRSGAERDACLTHVVRWFGDGSS